MSDETSENIKCSYTGFVCHRLKKEDSEYCAMHFDINNTEGGSGICSYISDNTGKRCLLPLNKNDELQNRFCHMHNKTSEDYLGRKLVPESYLNDFKQVFSNISRFKDPRFGDFDPTLIRQLSHDIMKYDVDPEYFSLDDPVPIDDVLTDEEYYKKQIFHANRNLEAWKNKIASVEQQKQILENKYKELIVDGKLKSIKDKTIKKRDKAIFQNSIFSHKDLKLIRKIKKIKSSDKSKDLTNTCKYELDGIRCVKKVPEFLKYCPLHFSQNFCQTNFFYYGCFDNTDENVSTEDSCFKNFNGNKSLNQSSNYKDEVDKLFEKLDEEVEKLDKLSSCENNQQETHSSASKEVNNKSLQIESTPKKSFSLDLFDKETLFYHKKDKICSHSDSSSSSLVGCANNRSFYPNDDLNSRSSKSSIVSLTTDNCSPTDTPKIDNLEVTHKNLSENINSPKTKDHTKIKTNIIM